MSGQLMIGISGCELTPDEQAVLQHPRISGVILFTRNYHDKPQLQALTQSIKQVRSDLLIAVDHEGGRVQRFREGFTELPAFADLATQYHQDSAHGMQAIQHSASTVVSELRAVGIDFSFTPVLDVDIGVSEIIGNRSFGNDPALVATLGGHLIDGIQGQGMPCVAKHFPGHGGVAADTHTDEVIDSRSYDQLVRCDMLPFVHVFDRVAGVMLSHVIYPAADSQPASVSKFWMHTVLRERLQYQGVVISDDLLMAGAGEGIATQELVNTAFDSGCDLALICNEQDAVVAALEALPSTVDQQTQERLERFACMN